MSTTTATVNGSQSARRVSRSRVGALVALVAASGVGLGIAVSSISAPAQAPARPAPAQVSTTYLGGSVDQAKAVAQLKALGLSNARIRQALATWNMEQNMGGRP